MNTKGIQKSSKMEVNMASVKFKGDNYTVLQTETISLPQKATEVSTGVAGIEVTLSFKSEEPDEIKVIAGHE